MSLFSFVGWRVVIAAGMGAFVTSIAAPVMLVLDVFKLQHCVGIFLIAFMITLFLTTFDPD